MNRTTLATTDNAAQEDALAYLQRIRAYELEEARRLQLAFIPTGPIWAPAVTVASKIRPVSEVGGDFLDYFLIPDGRLGFYVGDVVGKGLPAALYAALAVGTLRGFNKHMETPSSLLAHLNQRLLVHKLPGRYCAVQYGLYDPATGELGFSNAALPLPLHLSNAGPVLAGEGGLPSGLLDGAVYELHTLRLQPGESVVFYTDGIAEAANADEEEFGCGRLAAVCERHRTLPVEEQLERLFEAVDEFVAGAPQHDDMTALILKIW